MARPIVGSMSEWSGALKDLFRQIDDGSIDLGNVRAFTEHRNPFGIRSAEDQVVGWQSFYKDVFGIEVDFSGLRIPEHRDGFDRLIVVAQGMMPERLFAKCKELFPVWKWTNSSLDEAVRSERTAKTAYAVWFRDRVEADEELKNLSANQLKEQGISGITLEERLLYELKFFKETGKHLDQENWTLCAGSRGSYGFVPDVRWNDDLLRVNWCYPQSASDYLRARAAVPKNS